MQHFSPGNGYDLSSQLSPHVSMIPVFVNQVIRILHCPCDTL